MRALLDVNFLIALFDSDHVAHSRAHQWWQKESHHGWASCPLTENGFIRILSGTGYKKARQFKPSELISLLFQFASQTDHKFWPDTVSFCDSKVFADDRIHSSNQLTDIYLLALATENMGRLVTFDERIVVTPVRRASLRNLCVV